MNEYKALTKELNLTDAEDEFLRGSRTGQTPEINQSRVIAEFYVSKNLRDTANKIIESNDETTDKIIKSNEKSAAASGQYARALNILTGVLAFATLVLAFVTLVAVLSG